MSTEDQNESVEPDMDMLTHIPTVPSAHRVESDMDQGDEDKRANGSANETDQSTGSKSPYLRRDREKTKFYSPGAANFAALSPEPSTVQEALSSSESLRWK